MHMFNLWKRINQAIHLEYVHFSVLEAKKVFTKTENRNIGTLYRTGCEWKQRNEVVAGSEFVVQICFCCFLLCLVRTTVCSYAT